MKFIHTVEFSVFVKQSDVPDLETYLEQLSHNFLAYISQVIKVEESKLAGSVNITFADGEDEFIDKIGIIRVKITKKAESLLSHMIKEMSQKDFDFLKETLETRVDEEGQMYMRFEKEEFIQNKKISLVDHGNCVRIASKIAAYPQNQKNATDVAKRYLNEIRN